MNNRLVLREDQLRRAHPGLRLDKFTDLEEPDWKVVAEPRLDDGAYRLAYRRWERHWSLEAPGRFCAKGRVNGRLAIGLGNESVLEVGIRLSHSYGTPVIPGSALKGLLRARIEDQRLGNFLFGSENSSAAVEFQDAWWIPEGRSPLSLDVMTVHHPEYYAGRAAPTDFDNPNPLRFLSVRGSFLFTGHFLCEDPRGVWKAYTQKLLKDTLEKDGVGGKRSAGYGRFQFGG